MKRSIIFMGVDKPLTRIFVAEANTSSERLPPQSFPGPYVPHHHHWIRDEKYGQIG